MDKRCFFCGCSEALAAKGTECTGARGEHVFSEVDPEDALLAALDSDSLPLFDDDD